MLSTCAQAFALELQAFSLLPFQQTTDLVEKLRAENVAFDGLIIPDEIHDLLRWSDWVISKQRRILTLDFRHPIPSMSKNVAFVLRHSFVIRHSLAKP